MCSGFELEDENEVTTSIKKVSGTRRKWRATDFEVNESRSSTYFNDINRVAFSRRCRSKQIPNDGELVDKLFKL